MQPEPLPNVFVPGSEVFWFEVYAHQAECRREAEEQAAYIEAYGFTAGELLQLLQSLSLMLSVAPPPPEYQEKMYALVHKLIRNIVTRVDHEPGARETLEAACQSASDQRMRRWVMQALSQN